MAWYSTLSASGCRKKAIALSAATSDHRSWPQDHASSTWTTTTSPSPSPAAGSCWTATQTPPSSRATSGNRPRSSPTRKPSCCLISPSLSPCSWSPSCTSSPTPDKPPTSCHRARALAPGSYLVICRACRDEQPSLATSFETVYNSRVTAQLFMPAAMRSPACATVSPLWNPAWSGYPKGGPNPPTTFPRTRPSTEPSSASPATMARRPPRRPRCPKTSAGRIRHPEPGQRRGQ